MSLTQAYAKHAFRMQVGWLPSASTASPTEVRMHNPSIKSVECQQSDVHRCSWKQQSCVCAWWLSHQVGRKALISMPTEELL